MPITNPDPGSLGFWIPIAHSPNFRLDALAAPNYYTVASLSGASSSAVANAISTMPIPLFASNYAIDGKTPKLKVAMLLGPNGTSPGVTLAGGLSLLVGSTGAAGGHNLLFSTHASAPVAVRAGTSIGTNTFWTDESPSSAFPTDGWYYLTMRNHATTAANSRTVAGLSLMMRHE